MCLYRNPPKGARSKDAGPDHHHQKTTSGAECDEMGVTGLKKWTMS